MSENHLFIHVENSILKCMIDLYQLFIIWILFIYIISYIWKYQLNLSFSHDEYVGYEGSILIPQTPAPFGVIPIQTYPSCPHDAPHEFLTIQ